MTCVCVLQDAILTMLFFLLASPLFSRSSFIAPTVFSKYCKYHAARCNSHMLMRAPSSWGSSNGHVHSKKQGSIKVSTVFELWIWFRRNLPNLCKVGWITISISLRCRSNITVTGHEYVPGHLVSRPGLSTGIVLQGNINRLTSVGIVTEACCPLCPKVFYRQLDPLIQGFGVKQ